MPVSLRSRESSVAISVGAGSTPVRPRTTNDVWAWSASERMGPAASSPPISHATRSAWPAPTNPPRTRSTRSRTPPRSRFAIARPIAPPTASPSPTMNRIPARTTIARASVGASASGFSMSGRPTTANAPPPNAPMRPPIWGRAPDLTPMRTATTMRTRTTTSKRFTAQKYGRAASEGAPTAPGRRASSIRYHSSVLWLGGASLPDARSGGPDAGVDA